MQYEDASCDLCGTNISSKTVRITCAHSDCQDWDTCVTCFATGQTRTDSKHRPWHPYRVIAPIDRPLFVDDWSGDEEYQLLQSSEKYGLGNWTDVADHVGNGRTKEECAAHYDAVYLRSKSYPVPAVELRMSYDVADFQARKKRRITDRIALQKIPMVAKQKPITSTPECHEVAGYMPGRLEFSYEYENDAEISVKDMEFDQDLADDNQEEVGLKLTLLDIYNSRLTRRSDRKRVMFEHGLLDYKKNQANEKRRAKEVRDLVAHTKPLARLQSQREYDLFIDGLVEEMNVRRRISELQEWRRMGLTCLEAGAKYEKDKQQRQVVRSLGTGTPGGLNRFHKHTDSKRNLLPGLSTASADNQLLSREEQSLCSNLRLLPKAYLAIKETIVRELWRTGGLLTKKQSKHLLKIDSNKTTKVYEYLASHFHLT